MLSAGVVIEESQAAYPHAVIYVGLYVPVSRVRKSFHQYGMRHVHAAHQNWLDSRFTSSRTWAEFSMSEGMRSGVHTTGRSGAHGLRVGLSAEAVLTLASPCIHRGRPVVAAVEVEDMLTDAAGFMAKACEQSYTQVCCNGKTWRVAPASPLEETAGE